MHTHGTYMHISKRIQLYVYTHHTKMNRYTARTNIFPPPQTNKCDTRHSSRKSKQINLAVIHDTTFPYTTPQTHIHIHTPARTHVRTHTSTPARTHARLPARPPARPSFRTHAHQHARMHACTHTCTHAHTQAHRRYLRGVFTPLTHRNTTLAKKVHDPIL